MLKSEKLFPIATLISIFAVLFLLLSYLRSLSGINSFNSYKASANYTIGKDIESLFITLKQQTQLNLKRSESNKFSFTTPDMDSELENQNVSKVIRKFLQINGFATVKNGNTSNSDSYSNAKITCIIETIQYYSTVTCRPTQ